MSLLRIQCQGTKNDGYRCSRQVLATNGYCYQHQKCRPVPTLHGDMVRLVAAYLDVQSISRLSRVCQVYHKALANNTIFWKQLARERGVNAREEMTLPFLQELLYKKEFQHEVYSIYPADHFIVGFIPGYRAPDPGLEQRHELNGILQPEREAISAKGYCAKLGDFFDDILVWYLRSTHADRATYDVYREYLNIIYDAVKVGDLIDTGFDNIIEKDRYYFVYTQDDEWYVRNMKGEGMHYLPPESREMLINMQKTRGPLCNQHLRDLYSDKVVLNGFGPSYRGEYYAVSVRVKGAYTKKIHGRATPDWSGMTYYA